MLQNSILSVDPIRTVHFHRHLPVPALPLPDLVCFLSERMYPKTWSSFFAWQRFRRRWGGLLPLHSGVGHPGHSEHSHIAIATKFNAVTLVYRVGK